MSVRQTIVDSLGNEHEVYETSNGNEAWKILETIDTISLVFIDMNMSMIDSLLLMKNIRATECQRIANLPIIVITEHENAEAAEYVSGIIGATSFITKPFDPVAILKLVNSYARQNKTALTHIQTDRHDKLTGCLNEGSFSEHCSGILEYAKSSHENTSLLCIQIMGTDDEFENLDESISEQIIVSIADYLKQACRKDEKVAYLGASRFSIVLLTTNDFRAHIAGKRLQKKISTLKFMEDDIQILLKAAIGISSTNISKKQYTFDMLRIQAEQALDISMEEPDAAIVRYDGKFDRD